MAAILTINYYDRQGNIIDMETFARLHEDINYKRVLETTVGHLWVSTVWLGIDHGFVVDGEDRKPVIFETMVFNQRGDEPWSDEICVRYCTEEDARRGHQEVVDSVEFVIDEEPTLI